MPRIIAGKAKGTRLLAPPGDSCRPSSDRLKEALFSIIGDRILGARVLDLFAGTGQIGLEALSRGAREAVMVEKDRRTLEVLRTNLARTRLEEGARILAGDYRARLRSLVKAGESFDLIYLDPPWQLVADLAGELSRSLIPLLAPDALLILESEGQKAADPLSGPSLTQLRSCQYGSGMLSFYQFTGHKDDA